jgi:DNA-binding NarL/FixJ family response regulator
MPVRVLVQAASYAQRRGTQRAALLLEGAEDTDAASGPDDEFESRLLSSHPLCDYSRLFRPYATADALVVDADPASREALRALASKIVVKGKLGSRAVPGADSGRNVTVNTCSSRRETYRRLFSAGETYALVVVHEPALMPGVGLSMLKTLREAGYRNAVAVDFDRCTTAQSRTALALGASACLVRNTGTLSTELARLLAALVSRRVLREHGRSGSVDGAPGERLAPLDSTGSANGNSVL